MREGTYLVVTWVATPICPLAQLWGGWVAAYKISLADVSKRRHHFFHGQLVGNETQGILETVVLSTMPGDIRHCLEDCSPPNA